MTTEIKGKIKLIGELQTFDSGFTKLQIVVTEEGQYPNDIPIDFLKDKTDFLQNFSEGDEVDVFVNIRGSEYNGKYYVGLVAWKIQRPGASQGQGNAQDYAPPSTKTNPKEFPQSNKPNSFVDAPKEIPNSSNTEEFEDLPF